MAEAATLTVETVLEADLVLEHQLSPTLDAELQLIVQLAEEQGMRGPPGRDGAPGGALARSTVAPLSGGRVVVARGPELVAEASALERADAELVLGLSLTASSVAGGDVLVVRLGLVEDSSWRFVPGQPVYCGPRGELVQRPSTAWAYWRQVGVAIDATHVFVDLEPPIYLEQE